LTYFDIHVPLVVEKPADVIKLWQSRY